MIWPTMLPCSLQNEQFSHAGNATDKKHQLNACSCPIILMLKSTHTSGDAPGSLPAKMGPSKWRLNSAGPPSTPCVVYRKKLQHNINTPA